MAHVKSTSSRPFATPRQPLPLIQCTTICTTIRLEILDRAAKQRFGTILLGELRHSCLEWHQEAGGGKPSASRRFSIAVNRLAKVIVGDLVVVRVGNLDRVTQPCSHHVSRESLSNQFGRTTGGRSESGSSGLFRRRCSLANRQPQNACGSAVDRPVFALVLTTKSLSYRAWNLASRSVTQEGERRERGPHIGGGSGRFRAFAGLRLPGGVAHLTHAGSTLVVRGDAAADQVTITQDDARGTLTVTGVDSKSAVFSSAKVGSIQVNLGGGDDRFEYATVHGVRNPKRLNVDLGAGDDTGIIRWADDGGVVRRGLTLVANGGTGDDAIGVRVGRLGAGTTVSLRLLGGRERRSRRSVPRSRGRGGAARRSPRRCRC